MKYSENALKIYKKLYFAPNETTPEEVHERVAKYISNTEEEFDSFRYMLDNNIFRPNTPILINAGLEGKNPWDNQLCACHVLGLEDSMESIIDMWSTSAKIFASGAGIGIPITNLREKGAPISGGGEASGALAYLEVIEQVAKTVRSGGRARRSAIMGTYYYKHPEVFEITKSKSSEGALSSFNLSMLVDNFFMLALMNKEDRAYYNIQSPKYGAYEKTIKVKDLWNVVIDQAWSTGDPGLQFFENINKDNPFPSRGAITTTNPCGEVPLPDWSVCCLGSINLNKILTKTNKIDWGKFEEYIKWGVKFLDNVIDKTTYLHPNFEKTMLETRPIGLGIMGFADLLYKLKIGYNSEEARKLFERICNKLTAAAINESIEIAKKKGKIKINEQDESYFERLLVEYQGGFPTERMFENFYKYGIRNSTWTSIAPTGSISISADCSYSFEPHFALAYDKQLSETGEVLTFVNPIFEEELDKWLLKTTHDAKHNKEYIEEKKKDILNKIKIYGGTIQGVEELPQEMKNIFVTAHDISPIDKLKMQSAGQKFISLGISSTCNLPKSATREDISNIFIEAWKLGLKGITVYRDGCKEDQPIHFGQKECKEKFDTSKIEWYVALKNEFDKQRKVELMARPIKRIGETCEINTPHGRLFITGNKDEEGRLFETFLRIGKQGSLNNLLIDALSRCISKSLQSGLTLDVFTDTLRGNKEIPFRFKLEETQEEPFYAESLVDAIGIVFQELFLKESVKNSEGHIFKQCPNCGKWGIDPSGCTRGGICIYCAFSNCS